MKRSNSLLVTTWLALTLAACGGGDAAPSDPTPVDPRPQPQARATDKGTPLGAAVEATIGAEGGELTSADGRFSVSLPPGAVSQPTRIGIQPISGEAHGALGSAYRLTPEGVNFAADVTLRWRYDDRDLAGTHAQWIGIATQDAQGVWRRLRTAAHDPAQRTMSVLTRHFSDWSPVSGAQLVPREGAVRVGESLTLGLKVCEQVHEDSPDGVFVALLMHCDDRVLVNLSATDWQVNGVPGGNAAVGTLAVADADKGRAVYTAPAALPSRNPVAVSVRVKLPDSPTEETVVANITVIDESQGCAWLADVQGFDATVSLDYQFTGTNRRGDTLSMNHTLSGTTRLLRVVHSGNRIDFRGTLGGALTVADRQTLRLPAGDSQETLDGSGAPYVAEDEFSAFDLTLDLTACTYRFAVEPLVRATYRNGEFSDPEAVAVLGALSTQDRGAQSPAALDGQATVPASWIGGEEVEHYVPHGLSHEYFAEAHDGAPGSAQVRWTLRPIR